MQNSNYQNYSNQSTSLPRYTKLASRSIPSLSRVVPQFIHSHDIMSSNFQVEVHNQSISIRYELSEHIAKNIYQLEESLLLMSKAFTNQRRMYKYAKAWNSYQNDYISDDEMDKIEEKLLIDIDKTISKTTINKMIHILFQNIQEDDFDVEELSTILGVSRESIVKITANINKKVKI